MKKLLLFILPIAVLFACKQEPKSKIDDPDRFQWDFTENRVMNYIFSGEGSSTQWLSNTQSGTTTEELQDGELILGYNKNGQVSFDLQTKTTYNQMNEAGDMENSATLKVPSPMVVQKNSNNGQFAPDEFHLFQLLFPLPKKNLQVGETETIDIQIPINSNGEELQSVGTVALTLTQITEEHIAIFEGKINAKLDQLPEGVAGEAKVDLKGNGKYHFHIDKNEYLSSEVSLSNKINMNVKDENEEAIQFEGSSNEKYVLWKKGLKK